jgi:DNA repair exonuclease SbcCD ATPase subunit
MTDTEPTEEIRKQIAQVSQRLAEANARIPKHDVPAALIAEIDDLEQELERLQTLTNADPLEIRIAELEERLAEARARVPKHSVPGALIAEIDELDEELEGLRAQRKAAS